MLDPQKTFHNFLRSMGDLSGRISPQWWRGAYLAIYEDHQPELLFRLEGCEMKRIVDLGGGEYQFQYRIFTTFRDPENQRDTERQALAQSRYRRGTHRRAQYLRRPADRVPR